MDNNYVIRNLRYALDISDVKMVEIFKLGGCTVDVDEVKSYLKKEGDEGYKSLKTDKFKQFLDGFIIFKRGPLVLKPGQNPPADEPFGMKPNSNNNNLVLKKLRVALNYKSDDMLKAFHLGEVDLSEHELSALFRKKDHPNYKECGDKFIRVFLRGLVALHRGN